MTDGFAVDGGRLGSVSDERVIFRRNPSDREYGALSSPSLEMADNLEIHAIF